MSNRLRHRKVGNCGLTPKEAEVLDLWDSGHGTRQIAEITGRKHREVSKLVMMYHAGGDGGEAERGIAAGSALLLSALREQGMVPA